MDFKKLVIGNLEEIITESYYQCEEKQGLEVFGAEREKYEKLESELIDTLKSLNIPSEKLDVIDKLTGDLAALTARTYFVAGAKEMLKGAF